MQDELVYGGDLSMTPEFLSKECGHGLGRFCCPVNLLTCHGVVESTLGNEHDEFFGKDLEPYFQKAPGTCWSHLPQNERDELTAMLFSRMLPELKGIKRLQTIDDIPDDMVFNVIKLKPGESLEDIPAIAERVRKGKGIESAGKIRAADLKAPAVKSDSDVYRFSDGFYKISEHLEICNPPEEKAPQIEKLINDFLPIFRDCFSPESPNDEELAVGIFSDILGEPAPVRAPPAPPPVVPAVRPPRLGKAARQSGVTGVSWNEKGQSWMATWYESGKKVQKHFPVAEDGEEGALLLAIALRKKMEDTGKAAKMRVASRQSGHTGVKWHEGRQAWDGSLQKNGKQVLQSFASKKYGDAEALRLAVAWRESNQVV